MPRPQPSNIFTPPMSLVSSMPLPTPTAISILDFVSRRKRQRFTILAFVSLLLLSTYTILVNPLTTNPAVLSAKRSLREERVRRWPAQHLHRASTSIRKEEERSARDLLQLTPEQELAAVASFISNLPSNVLPTAVDPSQSIDPQLVLGFDLRAESAAEELANIVRDVWQYNPVMLFSKVHSPLAREVKSMLKEMNLLPAPLIFEVDERADADVLLPLLHRLTGVNSLPNLLIGGKAAGGIERIRELHESGELRQLVSSAGAILDGGPKKKKKKVAN